MPGIELVQGADEVSHGGSYETGMELTKDQSHLSWLLSRGVKLEAQSSERTNGYLHRKLCHPDDPDYKLRKSAQNETPRHMSGSEKVSNV